MHDSLQSLSRVSYRYNAKSTLVGRFIAHYNGPIRMHILDETVSTPVMLVGCAG